MHVSINISSGPGHDEQYILRSFGSLTTFNLLFADRADYFSSKADLGDSDGSVPVRGSS